MDAEQTEVPRIVLVDSSEHGEQLTSELQAEHCSMTRVESIAALLEQLSTNACDLVVAELRVGGHSCLDLLQQVRQLHPEVPVLVVTAFGSIEMAQAAIQHGAIDFWTAPVTAQELMTVIQGQTAADVWVNIRAIRTRYIEATLKRDRSLAQTARSLGVDRRSLRRMLERSKG
ncbi:MAG: hypothetical protein RL701_1250 [Pseudomonadota bacterium]|jgi:DNA-binding NtrC family response regulator